MNLKTAENTFANPQICVVPTKEGVRMTSRFSARVLALFAENHRHISQEVSAVRENKKAPLGWHRTRPDHNRMEVRHGY